MLSLTGSRLDVAPIFLQVPSTTFAQFSYQSYVTNSGCWLALKPGFKPRPQGKFVWHAPHIRHFAAGAALWRERRCMTAQSLRRTTERAAIVPSAMRKTIAVIYPVFAPSLLQNVVRHAQ